MASTIRTEREPGLSVRWALPAINTTSGPELDWELAESLFVSGL